LTTIDYLVFFLAYLYYLFISFSIKRS